MYNIVCVIIYVLALSDPLLKQLRVLAVIFVFAMTCQVELVTRPSSLDRLRQGCQNHGAAHELDVDHRVRSDCPLAANKCVQQCWNFTADPSPEFSAPIGIQRARWYI